MPGTRSSARQAAQNSSSPASSQDNAKVATGEKRKASNTASPTSKRGKKSSEKEQTTIEATLPVEGKDSTDQDIEMTEQTNPDERQTSHRNGHDELEEKPAKSKDQKASSNSTDRAESKPEESETAETAKNGDEPQDKQHGVATEADDEKTQFSVQVTGSKVSDADNAVDLSQKREDAVPSTILEKGIIYFFFRGRVGIDEPSCVADIARSYIVLRPLPKGARLGDGPIGDEKNNRLLALPKKVLPKSPKDRFMTFVEKANISMDEIKESLSASDYSTKTAGARHTPASTPIGEGVYAITETGRDTHLAYILTLPSELTEVQKEVGLRKRSSYHTSAKNPESSGPASAQLPQSAEFSPEIQEEFAGRGWMPLRPEMLNYENCQFLIIGHGDDALEKAVEPQNGEEKRDDKKAPLEEVEKLEEEDAIRVKHLEGQ